MWVNWGAFGDGYRKGGGRGNMIETTVRWNDGYLEDFKCSDVRFGSDLLWMRLISGGNRHIPLRQVRWFSMYPESHEVKLSTESGVR